MRSHLKSCAVKEWQTIGPESCVVHREVQGEALTEEPVGQPLTRESDDHS